MVKKDSLQLLSRIMKLAEDIGIPISTRTYTYGAMVSPLIILARHGQAAYTNEEDHGGDIVEGTLKQEGKERIAESAEEIISELNRLRINQVHLISSPKNRCIESSDILEKTLTQVEIIVERSVEPALRDVKVIGPTAGLEGSYQRWEIDMKDGENWFASWMRKAKEGMQFYPGEESPTEIQSRVSSVLPMYLESTVPTILVCHEEIFGAIATELELAWTRPTYGEVWYLVSTRK